MLLAIAIVRVSLPAQGPYSGKYNSITNPERSEAGFTR